MEEYKNQYDSIPDLLVADAGNGSIENYKYLEKERIAGFVKFSYFHLEQQDKFLQDPSNKENLYYNAQQDFFLSDGQKMVSAGTETKCTDNDYERLYTKYQAQNCHGCPMRGACHDQKSNRVISVNHKLGKYKEQARQRRLSKLGIAHRKKRPRRSRAAPGSVAIRQPGLTGLRPKIYIYKEGALFF